MSIDGDFPVSGVGNHWNKATASWNFCTHGPTMGQSKGVNEPSGP